MTSSPPSSPAAVFSLRIVTLDHYMAPPIPDLDFCYSEFQGRQVKQVPVIRIFGSTPAGQKACLHIHRALPYLYIPCPDDLLHSPEEGHAYLHVLSHAVEKALSGGDILNRSFQPYESHISYLLQFMVDYNLYGMSHIHTSKFKFRPPLPDDIIPMDTCDKKHDRLTCSSSGTAENAAIWLSSTIPSAFVWSDLATRHDGLDDMESLLIKRQSICGLELDSSIDDIQNEKYKLYTSLSQTGSDVKMVQSLIPIWEEEYERSGVQVEVKSPKISKPLPEDVLKIFEPGFEHENVLSVLCSEAQNTSSLEDSAVGVEDKLDKYIKSFTEIHRQSLSNLLDESHKCSEEQCRDVSIDQPLPCQKKCESLELASVGVMSLSQTIGTGEPENLDNEALGLLSWLASSQAAEDLNTDGELAHEAILSPLLRSNSYKKAMEQVHMDYENASQQECQDILDSVEVPKTEELRGQGPVASSPENMLSLSPGNIIQQVDGSSDDILRTPQKNNLSEENLKNGKEKSSIGHIGKCTSVGFKGKYKRKKTLWGSLPLSKNEKEHAILEKPASLDSLSDAEMKYDSDCSSSSGSEERYDGLSKVEGRVQISCEKEGKISDFSVRDLMRRKRYSRSVQPESDRHLASVTDEEPKDNMMGDPEEPMHQSFKRGRSNSVPGETSLVNSLIGQDGLGQESMTNSEMFTQGYYHGLTGQTLQSKVSADEYLPSRKGFTDDEYKETPTRLKIVATVVPSMDELVKSQDAEDQSIAICSAFSGRANDIKSVDSHCFSKCGTCKISCCKDEMLTGYQIKTSCACARDNIDNLDVCLKSCSCGDPSVEMEMGTSLVHSQCRTYTDLPKESSLEYIEMAFSKKPPSKDEVGGISRVPLGTSGSVGVAGLCDKALALDHSFMRSNGHYINDLLPFFIKNSEGEKSSSSSLNVENVSFGQESALGVPCHFLNDGSVLYLLTHAFSPPSLNCVQQWVSEMVQQKCLKHSMGACKEIIPSSLDSSLEYKNGLKATGHHETPRESTIVPDVIPKQSPSQEYSKRPEVLNHSSYVDIVTSELQVAAPQMKENIVGSSWQDISQISGPDAKSILTPLSQIGFQDPTNTGIGQQLTLISIEIQAESRGDLLPDPQFDPINIISLAIQEDTSHTFEVYVLMRGNAEEPCKRNVDGISNCNFVILPEERQLLDYFVKIIVSCDPDVILGWEIQGSSLGFLAERAAHLGIGLLNKISRTPQNETKCEIRDPRNPDSESRNVLNEPSPAENLVDADAIISDEWGRSHASGIHVGGRIVLNVWRLMRAEIKLNMYSREAVSEEVLRRKIPSIPCRILNNWFSSGPGRARYRCINYIIERVKLNIQIMDQLDMINRTSELARVFGIDFFSVLSRGSQFRVESMLLRLAHTQNYLAISPGSQQVASQPAMECLPLVMEPESGFYVDPVVVLDFQSLYPSMIIGYNLCFSTCLGKVVPSKAGVLGVSAYSPDPKIYKDLNEQILLTPNGVMYVPTKVRQGVLPRLLEEILSTRIMVKQAMKKLMPSQLVLHRIFNARQLALKLIANVTYGYTAAGFSGRMPCAELADSIVQCGRRTLETAISFVNQHDKWNAQVIYGDTDSMFVLLKGRTSEEAFRIGNEIASSVTAMNPYPVTLKMEKVYQPCFLLTKKRYVGYSYESPTQKNPIFDAKGIETVRRDTCPVVAKTLEQSIRLIFEHQDISKVKYYLQRQWTRILSGKFSVQDFLFAKEVRLGTYRAAATSLPPAAMVAMKAMRVDPRAEPRYGERVPYVVIHGEPGARLVDLVIDPRDLLDINSPYRLNDLYYIKKQIIPALQRVFGLLGADLHQWFSEMPRPIRPVLSKRHSSVYSSGSLHEYSRTGQAKRNRIDTYYASKHCTLCSELVQDAASLCSDCSTKRSLVTAAVVGRTSRLEGEIQHLAAICRHCGGGDWIIEKGVKCTSLACSVFYERRKVQKELQATSNFATDAGFYPTCMVEWF